MHHTHTIKLSHLAATFMFLTLFISTGRAAPATILVLGDSISAAYGLKIEQGWVALLQQHLKQHQHEAKVINASITGDTSGGGLARIGPALKRHRPTIVILELGGNDGLRGLPPKRMQANLEQIILQSRQAGSRVLLLGMRIPPNYGRRYTEQFYQVYQTLSTQYQLAWVPFFLDGVGTERDLMQADGIHPAAVAQPVMMQAVWQQLQPMLTALK